MTLAHDVKVGSTSIFDYAIAADLSDLFSGAPVRGDDLTIPGRRGQRGVAKVLDAYEFSIPLTILGDSAGDFHDTLDSLRALCDTELGAKTVTRIKPTTSGSQTTTCQAMLELIEGQMFPDAQNGNVVLKVKNLDGCWYGAAATPTIPATITVAGTARTHRISLHLPGAGTLTNTTLGVHVQVTASADLVVEDKTTTGTFSDVVAAGDPLLYWFALAPGSNVITWSGSGTPTISYAPAYK